MVSTPTAEEVSKDSLFSFKEQNVHNVSVAESVVNGLKLQQKSKDSPTVRIPYIISENTGKMRCTHSPLGNRRKSASQLQYRLRIDPHRQSTALSSCFGVPYIQFEKPRRCPLRIAELAEPTKRHCIETWRERSNILPEFMLERLKRQVMNQKVIAQIPDAVECFKVKSPKKSLPCARKSVQQGKKHTVGESMIITEARNLSAIFAHHIATRLIKSQVTCPKSSTGRLKTLSDVVIKELNDQLFSKKRKYPEYCYDNTILEEMSMKITVWMLDIMKDAEQKLMEDQLKAKKYEENRLSNEDTLVTLINTYFHASKKNSKDLDEDEGPALDAVDSIISNVLNTCFSTSNSSTEESKFPEESTNDINERIEWNATNEDNISDSANVEIKETSENILLLPDQDELLETGSKYESIPDDDVDILTRNVNDEDVDENVSDGLVALEESIDERKKVKFTNVDNGPGAGELAGGEGEGGRDSNGANGHGGIGGTEPEIKHASQIGKRNEEGFHSFDNSSPRLKKAISEISFRLPNEGLLSFADEYWPSDLNYGYLKSSASMSKSMVSLANIEENEERYDTHESSSILSKDIKNLIHNLIKDETTALTENDTNSKFMFVNITVEPTSDIDNIEDFHEDKNAQQLEEFLLQQPSEENLACTVETCYKNAEKGDHLTNKDQGVDRSESSQTLIITQKPQDDITKFDYNVYPQNAPAWVCSNPSEESIQIMTKPRPKKKMAKCELRRWCVDMEKTVENLKEWNRWLEVTCKKVLIMKQQSDVENIFSDNDRSKDLKEWVKLKRSIDRDALLWRKLTHRTLEVLKNYYDPYGPLIINDKQSSIVVPKKKIQRQSLMETLYTIEGLSLWLHRSIVSTENCLKCNCSKFIKKSRTSPESVTGTQPSCSTAVYYNKVNREETFEEN